MRASPSSASSSAMSSGVAEVSTPHGADAEPLEVLGAAAASPRSTRTTTSRAARSVPGRGQLPAALVEDHDVRGQAGLASASAPGRPRSWPGCARARRRRSASARRGGPCPPRPRRRAGRRAGAPAGRPCPWSSSASSRRRNSLLLWVKRLELRGQPARASAISCYASPVDLPAEGDRLAVDVDLSSWTRTRGRPGSVSWTRPLEPVHHQDAGLGEHRRAEAG